MQIKAGDIFRWKYKDETPEQRGPWGRYHCKSQIAIATENGWMADTYWHSSSDTRWSFKDAINALDLEFLGNMADLDPKERWYADYYAAADIVDISHANSSRGNFYIRKGAIRNREKMLEVISHKIEEAESIKRHAEDRLITLRISQNAICGGISLEEIWL